MDRIKSKLKIGIVPLYVLIILLAWYFLASYTDTDAEKFFLSPQFEDAKGWDIYTLKGRPEGTDSGAFGGDAASKDRVKEPVTVQELFENNGDTVYLSRTLDEEMEQAGYTVLELDGTSWQVSVFLDDALLYTVRPDIDNRIGFVEFPKEYAGLQGMQEYVRLTLPPGYGGRTLTLAAAANSALESRGLPMIRLSSENIQTQLLVTEANRLAMPAAAFFLAAVLMLGLFFYDEYRGQRSYAVLLLAASALAQALRVLLNFEFRFSSRFSLDFIPAELLLVLAAGMPMLYLLAQMKRFKKWYAPVVWIPLVLCAALYVLSHFPKFQILSEHANDSLMLMYLPFFALMVFSALEWRDGNPVYRLFAPAFYGVIFCLAAAAAWLFLTGREESFLVTLFRFPGQMAYENQQYIGGILLELGMAVSLILSVRRIADTESALLAMSVRNELVNENLRHIQDSSAEIAAMRHDMLRHLHTILDLSHEEDRERLENYLLNLTKETETILPIKVCEHPVVNALVTRALAMAKKERIRMGVYVEVPVSITVADNDLCVLVMNMLDNAIEAAASRKEDEAVEAAANGKGDNAAGAGASGKEGGGCRIELTMHVRGRYLFVETINTCDKTLRMDEKTGLPLTTKGAGHGYGMKVMSDIAGKYKSRLQVRQEQDTVMVRTALLMPDMDERQGAV